jgi:hypothetical protein
MLPNDTYAVPTSVTDSPTGDTRPNRAEPASKGPAKPPESARTGYGAIARLVRMELVTIQHQHGPEYYIPLHELAERIETGAEAVEHVLRKVIHEEVEVVAARELNRSGHAFPEVLRGKAGNGYWPGVRLLSPELAATIALRRTRVAAAVTRVMGLFESVLEGDPNHDFSVSATENTDGSVTFTVTVEDGVQGMLRGTEGGV